MLTVAENKIIKLTPKDPRTLLFSSFTKRIAVNKMSKPGAVRNVTIPPTNCTNGVGGKTKPAVEK